MLISILLLITFAAAAICFGLYQKTAQLESEMRNREERVEALESEKKELRKLLAESTERLIEREERIESLELAEEHWIGVHEELLQFDTKLSRFLIDSEAKNDKEALRVLKEVIELRYPQKEEERI